MGVDAAQLVLLRVGSGPAAARLVGAVNGEMVCSVCEQPIVPAGYRDALCWSDPDGTTCVAHRQCLTRIGEYELRLRDRGLGSA
jgi:hypothetical protein